MHRGPSRRFSRIGTKRHIDPTLDPIAARNVLKETLKREQVECISEIKTSFTNIQDYIRLKRGLRDEILRQISDFNKFMQFYSQELNQFLEGEVDFFKMNTAMDRVIACMKDKKDELINTMVRGVRFRKIAPRLGPIAATNRLMETFKEETENIIDEVVKSSRYLRYRNTQSLAEIRRLEIDFETLVQQYEQELRRMIRRGEGFDTIKETMNGYIDDVMQKSIELKYVMENDQLTFLSSSSEELS